MSRACIRIFLGLLSLTAVVAVACARKRTNLITVPGTECPEHTVFVYTTTRDRDGSMETMAVCRDTTIKSSRR